MADIFISSAVRTAIGSFGGSLSGLSLSELATHVGKEAINRAGIAPDKIEQTVFGNVIHTEPRDMYLSRVAAINSGVPQESPALTLNRLCGSGLQAVVTAYEQILLGRSCVNLAGGAECMSRVGHILQSARFGQKMGHASAIDMMTGALTDPFGNGHMGNTAENVAKKMSVTRDIQDELAYNSHLRAAKAIEAGYFKEQILPIAIQIGKKQEVFDTDEHYRKAVSLLDFTKLKPAFDSEGTVTAGNSSGINDGAAALVLANEHAVSKYSMPVMAKIISYGLKGVAPNLMGLGPIPAVHEALSLAGLNISQIDCIESNEAFAAQACAVARELNFDPAITNPNGGAIALGHPVGASGAIILTKLIYELKRQDGRYGLATMCIGGGQGIAVIIENVKT